MTSPSRISSSSIAATVPSIFGSSARRTRPARAAEETRRRRHCRSTACTFRVPRRSPAADLVVDLVPEGAQWSGGPSSPSADRRTPRSKAAHEHHPRVGEVAPRAADLPDAVVRLRPSSLEELDQGALEGPCVPLGEPCFAALSATMTSPKTSAWYCATHRSRYAPGATRNRRGGSSRRPGGARPPTPYMICISAGSPAIARSSQRASRGPRPVAGDRSDRGSAPRRAASSSGSPSFARRRSAPAARSSPPRRCRRWARG